MQMQVPQQQQMPQGQLPQNAMAYGGNYYANNGLEVSNTTTLPPYGKAFNYGVNFHRQWMNSPMYRKMLSKSTGTPNIAFGNDDFNPFTEARINELNNASWIATPPSKKDKTRGVVGSATYIPWNAPMTTGPTYSWGDKNYTPQMKYIIGQAGVNGDDIWSTSAHEISHLTDQSGAFIPTADQDIIRKFASMYKGTNKSMVDYLSDPTETRARLNEFRERALKQGIYNPLTQPFNLKYLKNYKPEGGGLDPINSLKNIFTDEQLEYLLNNVSKNETPLRTIGSDQAAYGGTSPLGMYATGGGTDPTTTTTVPPNGIYDQTLSPTEAAKLNDPDYPVLIKLLDELAKKSDGTYYLSSITPGKQKELSRLITKFGLSHPDETIDGKVVKGYNISQNSNPDYTWYDREKKRKIGFFGGMTPEMYEDKVIESIYPADQVAKMTPVQKRRLYFKELGIDDTKFNDADLANTKKIYTNKKFFKETFYPAFTKTFVSDDYRKQKGDDWQIGLEHYDSYKWKGPTPGTTTTAQPAKYVCTENGVAVYNPAVHANLTPYDSYAAAQQVCYKDPGKLIPPPVRKPPFKYMTPDLVNMAAAAAIPPKKYLPWSPQLPFEPGDVVFEDWRAKAAERQSVMNKMMNQMNTYSPGSATASNLSFLAGQGSEGLIKDISDVDARNVATANQFSQQEIGRRDKNMAANLGRAEELYKGNVIANQQYDNSKRAYINNMAKTFGQAWKNRMQLGLLNNVNTMYPVDPTTGYSYYTGGKGTNNFNGGSGGSGSYSAKDMQALKAQYISYGYSEKAAEDAALKLIDGTSGKSKDDNKPNMADYKFD